MSAHSSLPPQESESLLRGKALQLRKKQNSKSFLQAEGFSVKIRLSLGVSGGLPLSKYLGYYVLLYAMNMAFMKQVNALLH